MSPYSHHILCAGDYSIPYARLSAECLARTLGCRIYVHLDGLKQETARNAAGWLAEVPGTHPTCGIFGVKTGEKIPGFWHQRMVNRVCELFSSEPALAVVDADFFLTRQDWGKNLGQASLPDVYSVASQMRLRRTTTFAGKTYSPVNTILFTLRPRLHLDLNRQDKSKDAAWVRELEREFPGARIDTGHQIDSMMHASFRAQLLGYRILNLAPATLGCHVGGFSHMKPSKLAATESERFETWIRRVRLSRAVWNYMEKRGWDLFLTPHMKQNLLSCEDTINKLPARPVVAASDDEKIWPEVPGLLDGPGH